MTLHQMLGGVCLLLLLFCSCTMAWDQRELDMYDLIEEVGMKPNFYEILGLTENATSAEIRRTFRQLSLVHHPDKSDAEDADLKFRRLVGVYEILRDKERREMYDKYLVDGMPDWRSALYYIRRARKMSMLEITVILFIIITVGQYLTSWAGYKEKRLAVEEAVRSKLKRERKAGRDIDFDATVERCMLDYPKPSMWNTLPCQLVRGARWLVCGAPFELVQHIRDTRQRAQQQQLEAEQEAAAQQEERAEAQRQKDRRKELKERRRKRVQELPEMGPDDTTGDAAGAPAFAPVTNTWSTARSGPWLDDDLVELARLVKKYPGGTTDRWEVIAEALERTVAEVTKMARIIRDRPHIVPVSSGAQTSTADGQQVSDAVLAPDLAADPPKKVKTRAADVAGQPAAAWSQLQQRALEQALSEYPKGASERWERIAKVVPGKTKEECMLRFKYLADQVKKAESGRAAADGEQHRRGGGLRTAAVSADGQRRLAATPPPL